MTKFAVFQFLFGIKHNLMASAALMLTFEVYTEVLAYQVSVFPVLEERRKPFPVFTPFLTETAVLGNHWGRLQEKPRDFSL